MRVLKTATFKQSFCTIKNKCFEPLSIQGLPYIKTNILGLKLVYSFIKFIIPLPATYIRHSWGNCQGLPRHLLKLIERIVRVLWQKDCWGTAEVNYAFKLLSWQLHCQRFCRWNSNIGYGVSRKTILVLLSRKIKNNFLQLYISCWASSDLKRSLKVASTTKLFSATK